MTIGYKPGEGAVVITEEGLGQFMFSGAIWRDPKLKKLVGRMNDAFGISDLINVEIGEAGISYDKLYQKRRDYIAYEFKQRDGVSWVGAWEGEDVGKGIARLIITEVPDEFFAAESIHKALAPQPVPAHHDDCCACDDHD